MKSLYINQFNHTNAKSQQQLNNFLTNLAPKQKKIVGEFLRYQLSFVEIYPSQDTVATNANCTRKHVNETASLLNDINFMTKTRRGFNKTCLYKFNNELFKFNFRQILAKHFSFLSWIPLVLLTSLQNSNLIDEVTLRKRDIFIYQHKEQVTANEEEDNQRKILKKKGNEVQSQLQISQKVKNLNLNLSIDEQIRLSQFPIAVLEAALLKLKNTKNVKLPSRYLIWLCNDICKNSNKKSTTVNSSKSNDELTDQNQNRSTNSKSERVNSRVRETRCPIMYMRVKDGRARCTCKTEFILEEAIRIRGLVKFWQSIEKGDIRYQFVNCVLPNLLSDFEILTKELQLRNIFSQSTS